MENRSIDWDLVLAALAQISPNLSLLRDTCNVYVVRSGEQSYMVDFGSGAVLDRLADDGQASPRAVLVTHHHRDQVQGLGRAAQSGIEIWVPPVERELIDEIEPRWQARGIDNNYNTREDRFSLLESVPVTGSVTEYRPMQVAGCEVLPLPTPGHTVGSVSYVTSVGERRVAFTGDLIYAPGKVWSLAATMWSYGEIQGVASTMLSLLALRELDLDLLLPSHGEPIEEPAAAIDATVSELQRMLDFRGSHIDLREWLEMPYVSLTPNLLHNRTSQSYGYVLKSATGKALLFDYGYDFTTGLPAGTDRPGRRPWLYTIERLKREQGIERIDVAIPTHYHDDHVAGMNLLRQVEGTQVWTPDNFSDVLERPTRYDLPCLWYEPIPVDRVLPIGGTVRWEEYEIGVHELRGHTAFAAAYSFEVDGTRVVVSGDQQDFGWGRHPFPERLNYIYQNRVTLDDFVESAELYRRLGPELMVGGHWAPRWVAPDYLDMLATRGELFRDLHRSLLPLDEVDLGLDGFAARIEPYRAEVPAGGVLDVEVWVRNPFPERDEVRVELITPPGWLADPGVHAVKLDGRASDTLRFSLRAGPEPMRRARIAADLTVGDRRLGQHAEALVTVRTR